MEFFFHCLRSLVSGHPTYCINWLLWKSNRSVGIGLLKLSLRLTWHQKRVSVAIFGYLIKHVITPAKIDPPVSGHSLDLSLVSAYGSNSCERTIPLTGPCKGGGGGGYPWPPSEFQTSACRYFGGSPVARRNFDMTSSRHYRLYVGRARQFHWQWNKVNWEAVHVPFYLKSSSEWSSEVDPMIGFMSVDLNLVVILQKNQFGQRSLVTISTLLV